MSNVSPVWILIQRSLKSFGNGNCLNNADGQVITTWFGFDNSPAKVSTFWAVNSGLEAIASTRNDSSAPKRAQFFSSKSVATLSYQRCAV